MTTPADAAAHQARCFFVRHRTAGEDRGAKPMVTCAIPGAARAQGGEPMIVQMRTGTDDEALEHVLGTITAAGHGYRVIEGTERNVIGVLGGAPSQDLFDRVQGLPGVEMVIRISKPYKLASREFHPERTVVRIGDVAIGGETPVLMAGPCVVEGREPLLKTAWAAK